MNNFNQIHVENLLYKIEKFYKKFYFNKLAKGLLVAFGIILSIFLLVNVIFYYVNIPTFFRYSLVYFLVVSFFGSVYYWIFIPILRLFKIKKGISIEEASKYIGNHFSEIDDSLLNVLQLRNNKSDLANAALGYQALGFKDFNFQSAVPRLFDDGRLKWVLLPVFFFVTVYLFNNQIIIEGSNRVLNYETDFSKIAPFKFVVENEEIVVYEGENIPITVNVVGNSVPKEVDVFIDGIKYSTSFKDGHYVYEVRNVSEKFEYYFVGNGFRSKNYNVHVVNKPIIQDVVITVKSPDYTGKPEISHSNPSVLYVNPGSTMDVAIRAVNYQSAELVYLDDAVVELNGNGNYLYGNFNPVISGKLRVRITGFIGNESSMFETELIMLKDEFPEIAVDQIFEGDKVGFSGIVKDDYGFKELLVYYETSDSIAVENLEVNGSNNMESFFYGFPKKWEEMEGVLYFSIRDNDVLEGGKFTYSKKFAMGGSQFENMDSLLASDAKDLKERLRKASQESQDISDELKKFHKDLINKNNIDWEEKQKLKSSIEKQRSFHEDMKNLKEKMNKHNDRLRNQKDLDEEIYQKQEQLQDLMERILSDENKELLKDLEKLLNELDKEKIQEHLKTMEKNHEDYNKELSRDLELFKQMELEQKFAEALDNLDKLKDSQEKLLEMNVNKEISDEDNAEVQDSILNEFKEFNEAVKEIDSLNKELKDPNELNGEHDLQEEIMEEMKNASDASKENKNKKSVEGQKNASKQLEELKKKMEGGMELASGNQQAEDLESLRRILENLLVLSFDQEDIMLGLENINTTDPMVVSYTKDQKSLIDNGVMISDSLYALSVRISQIESMVTKEVQAMNRYMNYSVENLSERKLREANVTQQKSLTAINNLALLLDEIINQMQQQQQQQNSKQGTGSCSKPGSGSPKPSMGNSKKKQEELAKQMKAMKKKMEKGSTPGNKNPGNAGESMSMEIAKLAAEQGALREEIRKMSQQLQKEGKFGEAGELKKLEEMMDKNEEDLINFNLDAEFFKRQEKINIKMLEAETASREREKDKDRKSEIGGIKAIDSKHVFDKYIKKRNSELEILRLSNPELTEYYKKTIGIYNLELND
ncbi:MAG: hypothetical protein ACPGRC_06545 [Salibacteraceae bacterium]